jgi:sialidase-1
MTPITDSKMEPRKMGLGNPFFCLCIDSLRSPAGSLWLSVSILSALLSPFFCRSTSAEPLLEKTILFTERSDGFTLYRIPGIVVTAKGSVLAYCEARKFSDADRGEIEIHLRRSTDGGKTFSAAKQVAHPGPRLPRNPHMPSRKQDKDMGGLDEQTVNNPVAIATRDGTVHLLYCVEYMRAFHLRSDDDGVTWSTPQEITAAFDAFRSELDWQAIATGPGHAIEMKSGRLCVPFWMATYAKKAPLRKAVGTIFSDDDGRTWQRGGLAIPDAGEPNIAPLSDGGVLLTARNSHAESRRLVTRSADGATNWSTPAFADELLEPGCMAGITAHPGTVKGPLLLFSHPHTTDREHAARRDVTVHLSRDDGKTWPLSKTLQPGPSAYSDLAVLPDGTVLCFYESGTDMPKIKRKRDWAYANLTLARFNLEWLTTQ